VRNLGNASIRWRVRVSKPASFRAGPQRRHVPALARVAFDRLIHQLDQRLVEEGRGGQHVRNVASGVVRQARQRGSRARGVVTVRPPGPVLQRPVVRNVLPRDQDARAVARDDLGRAEKGGREIRPGQPGQERLQLPGVMRKRYAELGEDEEIVAGPQTPESVLYVLSTANRTMFLAGISLLRWR
jgi:hypothetical protein